MTFDVKYRLGSIKVPGAGSVSRRDDDSSKFEAATICFAVFFNYTVLNLIYVYYPSPVLKLTKFHSFSRSESWVNVFYLHSDKIMLL